VTIVAVVVLGLGVGGAVTASADAPPMTHDMTHD
jgi:hypothetical protein